MRAQKWLSVARCARSKGGDGKNALGWITSIAPAWALGANAREFFLQPFVEVLAALVLLCANLRGNGIGYGMHKWP